MWSEAWGIAAVTHVSDEKQTIRISQLHFGLEMTEVHHTRAEIVADQDNVISLCDLKRGFVVRASNSKQSNQ